MYVSEDRYMQQKEKDIIIIGAGFAGLSAMVELIHQGYSAAIYEQSPKLGGRASSFKDKRTNLILDNGQHIIMKCYKHTLSFLQKIRLEHAIEFQQDSMIPFVNNQSQQWTLKYPKYPWNMISTVKYMRQLSIYDYLRLMHVYRDLKHSNRDHSRENASAWLQSLHQSKLINEILFHPIILATLNESPNKASANLLKKVLKTAFLDYSSVTIGFLKIGFSELCSTNMTAFLKNKNAEIHTSAWVEKIIIENNQVRGILHAGKIRQAKKYVIALPPDALKRILPEKYKWHKFFTNLDKLVFSPIVSIYLWFEKITLDKNFYGMIGTTIHWCFKRYENCLSLVVSAANHLLHKSQKEIVDMCISDIHQCFPQMKNIPLIYSRVIFSKKATCVGSVEAEMFRLPQKTDISNLFICGDWTDTGYPSTIESAVISGVKVGKLINKDMS